MINMTNLIPYLYNIIRFDKYPGSDLTYQINHNSVNIEMSDGYDRHDIQSVVIRLLPSAPIPYLCTKQGNLIRGQ